MSNETSTTASGRSDQADDPAGTLLDLDALVDALGARRSGDA